jgi:hypothetical protein
MWSVLRGNRGECRGFRESLEESASVAALPPALREHAAACEDCQTAADEVLTSRALLKALPSHGETARPWFAPRVIAAIAARESELLRSLDAWTIVPKLAARFTWVCALALLLASTWLYETPRSTPKSGGDSTVESLFDAPAVSAAQDDLLVSRLEKAQ